MPGSIPRCGLTRYRRAPPTAAPSISRAAQLRPTLADVSATALSRLVHCRVHQYSSLQRSRRMDSDCVELADADSEDRVLTSHNDGGALVAVLLNPPEHTSGARSRNAVARAATVLGHEEVRVVNLCAEPTASVIELRDVEPVSWEDARSGLEEALKGAEAVLGAWGVGGVTGPTRFELQAQIDWLYGQMLQVGIEQVWMVGGEPRHPSRWHQYVSDKYGRTTGGGFEERLAQVMIAVPIRRAASTCLYSTLRSTMGTSASAGPAPICSDLTASGRK